MSRDLFDVICELDDAAEWLADAGYVDEAAHVRETSQQLKGFIELRLVEPNAEPTA